MLFSCKENEKESAVQLPAPVVLQDEAKSGATYNRKNEMCRVGKRNAMVLVENEM